ncbi:PREDICTED: olfactory receptor 49-like [Nipponia nippon]|uniref:olfactory receptor 49-like n=1 Tax=Nipponia nippon TaxID=128390 RepID=UPI000510A5B0|nr:PREDICTED: olfactory receptor 49-like [Nipponia nippon]
MVKNFILVGFTDGGKLQIFVVFLVIYTSVIIGNLVIVTISVVDRGLRVPMYYFIWNFSLLEIAMPFDRYGAICYLLSYSTIMSNGLCSLLVLGSWGLNFALLIGPSIVVFQLPFCNQNVNHFFWDSAPLVKLSCTETTCPSSC